jgi:hypothetical protein
VLTTSVGASPTFCGTAEKVIIELNRHHSPHCAACTTSTNPSTRRVAGKSRLFDVRDRIGSAGGENRSPGSSASSKPIRPTSAGSFELPNESVLRIGTQRGRVSRE